MLTLSFSLYLEIIETTESALDKLLLISTIHVVIFLTLQRLSKRFNSSKKIEVFFLYLFATVLYCSVYRFIWWLLKKARFL